MENNKKGKAIILLYHQVGKNPVKQTNLDCYCDQYRFEEQMSYLYSSNYRVISMDELVNKINSSINTFEENYVVLTFDDGCNNFASTTLPILEKHSFPSTVYPVAGFLGRVASWPKIVNPDLNIVSKIELKKLSDRGVNIGAHTMKHVKLTSCNLEIAKEEVSLSKKLLTKVIGKKITSFSYPHGDYNKDVRSLVQSLGFTNAVTCNSYFTEPNNNLFELPRKYVTYFDTIDTFKNLLINE